MGRYKEKPNLETNGSQGNLGSLVFKFQTRSIPKKTAPVKAKIFKAVSMVDGAGLEPATFAV